MQTFFAGTGAAVFEWRLASSAPAGEGAGGPASGASMFPRVPQWMAGTGAAIFGPRYLRPADALGGGGLPSGDSLFPRMPQWVAGTAGAIFGPRYLSSAVTPPVYNPAGSLGAFGGGGGGGREFRKLVKKIEEDITARVQGTSPAPTPALPKTAVKSSSRIATKEAPPAEQELLQKVRQLEKELHFLAREVEALKVAKQASDENGEEAAIMSILLN